MDLSPFLRGFSVAEPRLLLSCQDGSEGVLSHASLPGILGIDGT